MGSLALGVVTFWDCFIFYYILKLCVRACVDTGLQRSEGILLESVFSCPVEVVGWN